MLLSYFTEEAYDRLLSDISKNAKKYLNEEDWVSEYFNNKNDYYKTSKVVDVRKFSPYISDGALSDAEKSEEDLVNVRQIYEAYKTLTPLQASNKYMWTYLCHCEPECRDYIKKRWMKNVRENTIRTRYFVTTASNLINDNALSRLWWYGHLTYDSSASDPYHLTKILLINQTICTDVMDNGYDEQNEL